MPVYRRDADGAGRDHRGARRDRRGRDLDLRLGEFRRAHRRRRQYRHGAEGGDDHERVKRRGPDPSADHVEPPDRRGRGAGAGADAHRLQPDRARMRRPLGRRVRPRGPHAGAGGHRHAGPRQFDGRVGQAFHRAFPARDDEAGRRLHHQRSLDGHRPSQRLRRHHALLPGRQGWSRCSPAPAI